MKGALVYQSSIVSVLLAGSPKLELLHLSLSFQLSEILAPEKMLLLWSCLYLSTKVNCFEPAVLSGGVCVDNYHFPIKSLLCYHLKLAAHHLQFQVLHNIRTFPGPSHFLFLSLTSAPVLYSCAHVSSISQRWTDKWRVSTFLARLYRLMAALYQTVTPLLDEHAPFNEFVLWGLTSDLCLRACVHASLCWKNPLTECRNEGHGKR